MPGTHHITYDSTKEKIRRSKTYLQSPDFWFNVDLTGNPIGCWVWIGRKNEKGYGLFRLDNERKAHRVAWALMNGSVPEGMQVLHKCDNKPCVNPEHLYLGTASDNLRDRWMRDESYRRDQMLGYSQRLRDDLGRW